MRSLLAPLAPLALLSLIGACHKSPPPREPLISSDGAEPGENSSVSVPAEEQGKADEGDERSSGGGLPGPSLPDGPVCDTNADCPADALCEGVGCGPGEGRCVPKDRICTRDLVPYCGCDGREFGSSGTCAGDRYAYRGPCDAQLELGEACTDGRQCKSRLCLGEGLEGCSPTDQGACGEAPCTKDLAPYCNCNNITFRASGSCPNHQFAYRGACEGA